MNKNKPASNPFSDIILSTTESTKKSIKLLDEKYQDLHANNILTQDDLLASNILASPRLIDKDSGSMHRLVSVSSTNSISTDDVDVEVNSLINKLKGIIGDFDTSAIDKKLREVNSSYLSNNTSNNTSQRSIVITDYNGSNRQSQRINIDKLLLSSLSTEPTVSSSSSSNNNSHKVNIREDFDDSIISINKNSTVQISSLPSPETPEQITQKQPFLNTSQKISSFLGSTAKQLLNVPESPKLSNTLTSNRYSVGFNIFHASKNLGNDSKSLLSNSLVNSPKDTYFPFPSSSIDERVSLGYLDPNGIKLASSLSYNNPNLNNTIANLTVNTNSPLLLPTEAPASPIKKTNVNHLFAEFHVIGIDPLILSGEKEIQRTSYQTVKMLHQFPQQITPIVDNLQEYCFPYGGKLYLLDDKEYQHQQKKILNSFIKYQIMQFTDSTSRTYYACCIITTEALPSAMITPSLYTQLEDLQTFHIASNIIKRYIKYYIHKKKFVQRMSINMQWEYNITRSRENSMDGSIHFPRRQSTASSSTSDQNDDFTSAHSSSTTKKNKGIRSLFHVFKSKNKAKKQQQQQQQHKSTKSVSSTASTVVYETNPRNGINLRSISSSSSVSQPNSLTSNKDGWRFLGLGKKSSSSSTSNPNTGKTREISAFSIDSNASDMIPSSSHARSDSTRILSTASSSFSSPSRGSKLYNIDYNALKRTMTLPGEEVKSALSTDSDIPLCFSEDAWLKSTKTTSSGKHLSTGSQLSVAQLELMTPRSEASSNDTVTMINLDENQHHYLFSENSSAHGHSNNNLDNETATIDTALDTATIGDDDDDDEILSQAPGYLYSKKHVMHQMAYCILSDHPSPSIFFRILEEIIKTDQIRRNRLSVNIPSMLQDDDDDITVEGSSDKSPTMKIEKLVLFEEMIPFLNYLQSKDFFDIEKTLKKQSLTLSFPAYHKSSIAIPAKPLSLEEWCVSVLFSMVPVNVILHIHSLLLIEKSLLVIGSNSGLVSVVATAFTRLLKPFPWAGIFVTLLPPLAQEVLDAPVPYIIGMVDTVYTYQPISKIRQILNISPTASILHLDHCLSYASGRGDHRSSFSSATQPMQSPHKPPIHPVHNLDMSSLNNLQAGSRQSLPPGLSSKSNHSDNSGSEKTNPLTNKIKDIPPRNHKTHLHTQFNSLAIGSMAKYYEVCTLDNDYYTHLYSYHLDHCAELTQQLIYSAKTFRSLYHLPGQLSHASHSNWSMDYMSKYYVRNLILNADEEVIKPIRKILQLMYNYNLTYTSNLLSTEYAWMNYTTSQSNLLMNAFGTAINNQTNPMVFNPELILLPMKKTLLYQEYLVQTQMFSILVDQQMTTYLNHQSQRLFLHDWIWYRLYLLKKKLSLQQHQSHSYSKLYYGK